MQEFYFPGFYLTVYMVREWLVIQLMNGTVGTISAALIGGWWISRQIRNENVMEEQRRAAKAKAAIAILPLTLDKVHDYCTDSVLAMKPFYENALMTRSAINSDGLKFMDPPVDDMHHLIEFVQHDAGTGRACAIRCLHELQTFNSRIHRMVVGPRHKSNISFFSSNLEAYIVQGAVIHSLLGALYMYARESKEASVDEATSYQEVSRALWNLDFDSGEFPDLYAYAERRHTANGAHEVGKEKWLTTWVQKLQLLIR